MQLQTKLYLLQTVIATYVSCRVAQWHLAGALLPSGAETALPAEERRIIEVFRCVARRDIAEVRRLLPGLLKQLQKRPLLYVPLDHGGEPQQMLTARIGQAVVKFLLATLPRLGLLRETWHLLRTAHLMERASRPQGVAVTEFDRLFRIGLKNSLICVVESSRRWKSGRFSDEELIEVVGSVVEFYLEQWLDHSQTMRLSTVESLKSTGEWNATREFVRKYGGDLLNARTLTLGNIRTILHQGVDKFLDYLDETEDPLQPSPLLDDIRNGVISRDEVSHELSLIYQITVERFDRFLEYNTTTTQSDYGELFNSLLDFLRLESAYDRDSWNLLPVALAHEVLVRHSKDEAAVVWEEVFETKTELMAEHHLEELHRLERKYGMRLPSVANHLQERFVKPLMVNTMVATLARAVEDARDQHESGAGLRIVDGACRGISEIHDRLRLGDSGLVADAGRRSQPIAANGRRRRQRSGIPHPPRRSAAQLAGTPAATPHLASTADAAEFEVVMTPARGASKGPCLRRGLVDVHHAGERHSRPSVHSSESAARGPQLPAR